MQHLDDYIIVVKNAVPEELCDRIVNQYKNSKEWNIGAIGQKYDENLRNCSVIRISAPSIIEINPEARKSIDDDIFNFLSKTIVKYSEVFPNCIFSQDSGYDLLKYEEGQYIKEHIDTGTGEGTTPRLISCSIALNDDYEGGEFAFFKERVIHRLGKGDVIMFPSNFMYPHEILPVTEGTRYSIITWFI